MSEEIAYSRRVEIIVIVMYDDTDVAYLGMAQESLDGSREHGATGELSVLLGSASPGAHAAPGGDNEGDGFGIGHFQHAA